MAYYKFCELVVEMDPQFSVLRERSKPYLVPDGPADISLKPAPGYLRRAEESYPHLEAQWLEYMWYATAFYRRLLQYDGIMLHSSAVAADGRAYLFSAPPGTGKSTHTSGWLRMLGDRAYILNDDKPALRFFDKTLFACGTPFTGTSPLGRNARVPVAGICILERGEENRILPLTPQEALPRIYTQTIHTLGEKPMERMLTILEKVLCAVPLWRLYCNISEEACRLAYETMREGKQ